MIYYSYSITIVSWIVGSQTQRYQTCRFIRTQKFKYITVLYRVICQRIHYIRFKWGKSWTTRNLIHTVKYDLMNVLFGTIITPSVIPLLVDVNLKIIQTYLTVNFSYILSQIYKSHKLWTSDKPTPSLFQLQLRS